MRFFVVAALCLVLVSARKGTPTFEEFCRRFGKDYSSAEREMRAAVYEKNAKLISEHNAEGRSFHMKVNEYADWTAEELVSLRGYKSGARRAGIATAKPSSAQVAALPTSVDWRAKGKVTPIKNQGQCGSCWAFAGTASIESNLAINTGKLISLSEQEYVSCMPNPDECGGTGGCGGATPDLLFAFAMAKGSVSEASYPYTSGGGSNGQCSLTGKKPVAHITGFNDTVSNDRDSLMAAAAMQPVTIAVDASNWSFYSGGIMDQSGCGWILDHAVLVVGYGTDAASSTDYWIVKNSWGPGWGENGYIRLKRYDSTENCGTNTDPSQGLACKDGPATQWVCGACGMYFAPSYPTGAKLDM